MYHYLLALLIGIYVFIFLASTNDVIINILKHKSLGTRAFISIGQSQWMLVLNLESSIWNNKHSCHWAKASDSWNMCILPRSGTEDTLLIWPRRRWPKKTHSQERPEVAQKRRPGRVQPLHKSQSSHDFLGPLWATQSYSSHAALSTETHLSVSECSFQRKKAGTSETTLFPFPLPWKLVMPWGPLLDSASDPTFL